MTVTMTMTDPAEAPDGRPHPDAPTASVCQRAEPPAGQPISSGYLDPLTDEEREQLNGRLATMFPGDTDPADRQPKPVPPGHRGTVWMPGVVEAAPDDEKPRS